MAPPEGRAWRLDATKLSIVEQGSATTSGDFVAAVDPALWEALRLKVSRGAGSARWRIDASQFVGVARVQAGSRAIPLEVAPKLPVDVFFLADHAFGIRDENALVDRRLRADLAAVRTDPTACLIAWFLADVEAFARRFLRRTYELRREVLEGGLRERLLLEGYVANHLTEGRPQEAPCEFADLTLDTAANRAIRASVRLALARCSLLPRQAARAALRRQGRRILSMMAGIADERLSTSTFRRLASSPQPRRYARILSHCEAFASGLYMEHELGAHERQAFLWDMNVLFEEGLRGILEDWPGAALESARPKVSIHDPDGEARHSSRIDPDFVLRFADGSRLILDAKYKDVGLTVEHGAALDVGEGRLRVSRSDVYQAVAYRAHDRYPDAGVGLVFPVALGPGESLPRPHSIRGFGAPVQLFFLDVGRAAAENLPQFFDWLKPKTTIRALASANL